MFNKVCLLIFVLFFIYGNLYAQGFGFGFGEDSDSNSGTGSALAVSVNGEANASFIGYVKDFSDDLENVNLGDIFSGKLNFKAAVSFADAVINLNIKPAEIPVTLDEAYVRAYFGNFEAEGGIRKLTWGKADSFGPLDVINPLDYSQLTDLSNLNNFKIARPLVRLSYRFGSFSKLEGVFVPSFEPMRFAEADSRWYPKEMSQLDNLKSDTLARYKEKGIDLPEESINIIINKPDTTAIKYAQAGLRFTTTIGSVDFGLQYYYGRLTRPAVNIGFSQLELQLLPPYPTMLDLPSSKNYSYNPYHQIGIDFAAVLLGFNIRAEFAANITDDLSGDKGDVYNPFLAWSLGFDRALFWGISLSLQGNQTIRLFNDKVSDDPMTDTEAGADMTSTQIIASLSKTFLRDQLEIRAAVFWEVEGNDFMIIPSIVWTKDAVSVELSGGIFTGDTDGQFGQYKDNSFVKIALGYKF